MKKVAVVGAGLAGSLQAILMAKKKDTKCLFLKDEQIYVKQN